MIQQLVQGHLCDKAEICRARDWALSLGLQLLASLMQVELLVAKVQSFAIPLSQRTDSQCDGTERAGSLQQLLICVVLTVPRT